MVEDSALLRSNCKEYANSHGKAIDVLRNANGKNHYLDIAKKLSIPPAKVSGLLKKASTLGLSNKITNGCYKKKTGILGYMPKVKTTIRSQKSVEDLLKKITREKTTVGKSNQLYVKGDIYSTIDKMSDAYKVLYAVENTLRELIRKVFANEVDWWKNRIPSGIQTDVANTIKKTSYHAAKRKDELDYTHLGQLKEIIIYKRNWNNFVSYLNENDKNAFSVLINKAIALRNAIGHCIPLQKEDLRVVDIRFKDILKMIK